MNKLKHEDMENMHSDEQIVDKEMGGVWVKAGKEYNLYIDGKYIGKLKAKDAHIQRLKMRDALQNLSKEIKKAAIHDYKTIRNFIKKR